MLVTIPRKPHIRSPLAQDFDDPLPIRTKVQ
jgi:hypothetical protein